MLDAEIQNVIAWLTNGCDPSKAALELAVIASKARAEQARLTECENMNAAAEKIALRLTEAVAVLRDIRSDPQVVLMRSVDTRAYNVIMGIPTGETESHG